MNIDKKCRKSKASIQKSVKHQKQSTKKQKKVEKINKKISLQQAFGKVVDVVKKPFSGQKSKSKPQKKTRREKILVDNSKPQKNSKPYKNTDSNKTQKPQTVAQQDNSYVDVPFAESTSGATYSKFFYSNEYTIDNFDDHQLYEVLSQKYPGLLASEESEVVKRNAIITLLNDVEVMQKILEKYNMTILDFFKFLFRMCPSVFKGLFVKKVQKTLKDKPYAQSIKFGKYRFARKKSSSKKCSIF